ncbi:hypothetical protein KAT55_00810 [Candidatus Bathyarchaeota archaeon]|nr:hypothetical protein [Candidatus Bathyarchaeota archaeon]
MKVSRWTAPSIIFAVLLVASIYGFYSFIRMPLTRYSNNVDLRYTQSADYSYTAYVKPSLLYDNRTEIGEGELLYTKLVEQLDVTLLYNLTQNPSPIEMGDLMVVYETSGELCGGDWSKTYDLKQENVNDTFISISGFSETYTLNITEIEGIIETIGEETGARVHSYTYEIKPNISLDALAGNKTIEQEFAPVLMIKFEGGKIEFEGLSSSKSGSVKHLEMEIATWRLFGYPVEVKDMRGLSLIASIPIAFLLYLSTGHILRERVSRSFMDRLSDDIRDKIVEAQEPPERIERSTMRVRSMEDLARVAEEAFKPIIHHDDVFYVLDGDVRYEFHIEAVNIE